MIRILAFVLAVAFTPLTASTDSRTAPDSCAEPIRKLFDESTVVISDGDTELMVFWFRKSIPAKATAEQIKNGLTYREILETTLIAVVKLNKTFIDYRKQEIPAGVYTLRLVFQPDTGDHTGTAPNAEFLLFSPAPADKSPDETDVKSIVDMSKKATGGDHPGVMLLLPEKGEKAEPSISEKDGITVVRCKRTLEANGKVVSLGFGIVVKGVSKTR